MFNMDTDNNAHCVVAYAHSVNILTKGFKESKLSAGLYTRAVAKLLDAARVRGITSTELYAAGMKIADRHV